MNNVGQMITARPSPSLDVWDRPLEPRARFIQELKSARLEKVRLHRLKASQNGSSSGSISPPGPGSGSWEIRESTARPRPHPGFIPISPHSSGAGQGPVGRAAAGPKPHHRSGTISPRAAGIGPREARIDAGLEAEKRAAQLPWMSRHPPVDQGGQITPGQSHPISTIQTDLARAPAAIDHARVLFPSEDPLQRTKDHLLQVESEKQTKTKAFVRLASERCRTILLALPDSGNLCKAAIMSVSTFKALNRCAIKRLQLEPVQDSPNIRSVTGSSLKIEGRIKDGLLVQLQGTAGTLQLNPLVSSNFSGTHLNLSQNTMSRLKIQLRPNLQDGGQLETQNG